jgi:hypothetical protein
MEYFYEIIDEHFKAHDDELKELLEMDIVDIEGWMEDKLNDVGCAYTSCLLDYLIEKLVTPKNAKILYDYMENWKPGTQ